MRIAIIGANGQLGTDLRRRLPGELIGLDMPELDVRDPRNVDAALARARPDVVINCAAMTNVDACQTDPATAEAINAQGAEYIARAAARLGAHLIHISTDYVFGAQPARRCAYVETDLPGPVNTYGLTKLRGEQRVRRACPHHLIVRTCGLYGHAGALGKGGNFVETICRLAGGEAPLRVVADQTLSPTSTEALAGALATLVQHHSTGIVHLAAPDRCTWHEFAAQIVRHVAPQRDVRPIPSSEYPTPAPRPTFSALRSVRLESLGLAPLPGWRAMLADYLAARPTAVGA